MKSIFKIIVFILVLFSCKTVDKSGLGSGASDIPTLNENLDTLNVEYIDSDSDGVPDFDSYELKSPYDIRTEDRSSSEYIQEGVSLERVSEPLIKNESKNLKILDKTKGSLGAFSNKDISKGFIAYNIPEKMRLGKEYRIKVRITKDTTDASKIDLVIGDRGISINDTTIKSIVSIETIIVEKTMSAVLIGSDFRIESRSTDIQNIDDLGYTEWTWLVSPNKSGLGYLKLVVKVRVESESGVSQRDIVVFDKSIEVISNTKWSFKVWLKSYWQWLISTIIIPITIWLYKKRKDKSNS